ncbi:hypothetical protein F0726_00628 [Acidithiobacillus caldus]|nr:hypothetical protein F0726_00628 [Acidithiobacillus caldus]
MNLRPESAASIAEDIEALQRIPGGCAEVWLCPESQ